MKYVTVIPARGGSKRLPGKNIFPLGGKPLLAHSILYSRQVLPDTEVYVSTDSEEIARVACGYGAEVIERPDELSDDLCSTDLVMQHAATELLLKGKEFDYMILLQATNPLRPAGMMDEAIRVIETGQYDSLFAVSPLVRKLGRLIDGKFIPWNFVFGQRSQDMEPLYFENGLLYVTSKEQILKGHIRGESLFSLIVDHPFGSLDIDTREDFGMVEYYAHKY
ncbi:acylneuraminate cytidylyltransferase family protein [Parabacteroides sp. TM07-1AC]|uniref:acylneuraminate cytidylyltransferase family protein n=1 Tax=Parabacteroides sp. TM07-1AC TaxID=2292363 RepID=UPI000EFEAF28|nr:acylneuraminate cytidylyltransferase family protein [Parabacteroides sp. TM07-1AC]RHU24740.1 acylneuraminate cytidylyltransferase family protein [Parabacteroides sp. TM07-1AC]